MFTVCILKMNFICLDSVHYCTTLTYAAYICYRGEAIQVRPVQPVLRVDGRPQGARQDTHGDEGLPMSHLSSDLHDQRFAHTSHDDPQLRATVQMSLLHRTVRDGRPLQATHESAQRGQRYVETGQRLVMCNEEPC